MNSYSRHRIERIIQCLGLNWAEVVRLLNHHMGTNYRLQDARKWGKGRDVPLPVRIFLRMAVALGQAQRGRKRDYIAAPGIRATNKRKPAERVVATRAPDFLDHGIQMIDAAVIAEWETALGRRQKPKP